MKVFISWSGDRSKVIASALKRWLPDVFQGLQVWMSDQDIQAGDRWGSELRAHLKSRFGILCLTPENLDSKWMIFEAGALSEAIQASRVVPYRFQLQPADVGPPISQFQGVDADEPGTLKLVSSLNDALEGPLKDEAGVARSFAVWWPGLKSTLGAIPRTAVGEIRTDRDLLEEILELVRRSGIRDLNSSLGRILILPNVLKVEVAPKQVAGEVLDRVALRITVGKKLPLAQVPPDQLIPTTVFGMGTDVVEAAVPGDMR